MPLKIPFVDDISVFDPFHASASFRLATEWEMAGAPEVKVSKTKP